MKDTEHFYGGYFKDAEPLTAFVEPTKHLCQTHGEIEYTLQITVNQITTNHCMQCYNQFLRDYLPIVEAI